MNSGNGLVRGHEGERTVTVAGGPPVSGRGKISSATRRVLVLTPYLYGTAPGPRSSIELWEGVLEEAGITFEWDAFESARLNEIIYEAGRGTAKATEMIRAYGRRLARLRKYREFDAVLVYREAALIGPALVESLIARSGVPLIYQLDDPLYVPYRSPFNGYLSYLKFFGKVKNLCRMSSLVIVNSQHHFEFAAEHNANVWDIPSLVDGERFSYRPKPPGTDGTTLLGWSGSKSTAPNLREILHPLGVLGARDEIRFRFHGAESFDLPGVPHEARPWRPETEVDDIRGLDVGLLPVPDGPWNRRKFYLKLVQYMALGVPAVATPIGSNIHVMEDGSTGFLAEGDRSWIRSMERLADDPQLRAEMGRRAAETAHSRYTVSANAEKLVSAFESVVG